MVLSDILGTFTVPVITIRIERGPFKWLSPLILTLMLVITIRIERGNTGQQVEEEAGTVITIRIESCSTGPT